MNASSDSSHNESDRLDFPFAPEGWDVSEAERVARDEGLELGDDHWQLVRCLHEYFARHEEIEIKVRELKDALDETFHHKGGTRYLHRLLPGGPVAQGCRLAGLPVPPGAVDPSFGSVQ